MIRDMPLADDQTITIHALAFIASHDDLMRRFLDLSGLEADQVRAAAAEPGFFVGVLDFILANEDDVLDFASQILAPPHAIGQARNALAIAAGVEPVEMPAPEINGIRKMRAGRVI